MYIYTHISGNKQPLDYVKSSALLQKLCPFDPSLRRFSAIAFVLPKALLKRLEFNVDLAVSNKTQIILFADSWLARACGVRDALAKSTRNTEIKKGSKG